MSRASKERPLSTNKSRGQTTAKGALPLRTTS
jgi:hypothetical protein